MKYDPINGIKIIP